MRPTVIEHRLDTVGVGKISHNARQEDATILVTGASGYVGRRLREVLEAEGLVVRCLVRRPQTLRDSGISSAEIVGADLLDARTLPAALEGVAVAYYLVHSMAAGSDFEERDCLAARNFAAAAHRAGVRRIVYLGGLGRRDEDLSAHLRSRHAVGEILRSSGIQVIEFRASIVLGAGSLSFEMVRALVERLPVMVTPRWVDVLAQPIATPDLMAYLRQALDVSVEGSPIFEIGGADRVSYGDIMREYARQRGLRRLMIRVPLLTPRLSSLWLALVTPLYAKVGRALIDSIRHPTVVEDDLAADSFSVRPRGAREAIEHALREEEHSLAQRPSFGVRAGEGQGRVGHHFVDSRETGIEATPEAVFACVRRIGGRNGWYYGDFLWRLRGALDAALGGVGLRRGRRDPEDLRVGDCVDFWRVEIFEPDRRLRLKAEMKLPGSAWLEFEVCAAPGGSILRQTAIFDPRGLAGVLYWYALLPIHDRVFGGMLRSIAVAAQRHPGKRK